MAVPKKKQSHSRTAKRRAQHKIGTPAVNACPQCHSPRRPHRVCPVCGSAPMTSSVVGWPKAHNTRFCTCSLCATMWNVVRVKCVLCSSTGGISYRSIEGKPETVKEETCESCHAYVKILYQVNDSALDPLADDVATLGLDMLMAEEGWKRGGHNPFLMGY